MTAGQKMSEAGRVERVRRRANQAKDLAEEWRQRVEAERPRQPIIDTAYETYERDGSTGGSLLAGAIAFRLFLVLIPWTLVQLAILGFLQSASSGSPEDLAEELELSGSASGVFTTAAEFAVESRWTALAVGLFALVIALRSLVKAFRITHSLAWGVPLVRPRLGVLMQLVASVGLLFAVTAAAAVTGWLREWIPGAGLTASIVLMVFWTLVALAIEVMLPRDRTSPWYSVIPGAVLIGIATQCLHAFTVFYLAGRIERMSSTYGPLGVATVMMLWLFILARTFVVAAMINATILRPPSARRRPVAAVAAGGSRAAPDVAVTPPHEPRNLTSRSSSASVVR